MGPPVTLHSDQGSTYASGSYWEIVNRYGISQSMRRKGDCWDNAPVESFFHTLKTELMMHCDYKTRDGARASLFDYMEVFYNRRRRRAQLHVVLEAIEVIHYIPVVWARRTGNDSATLHVLAVHAAWASADYSKRPRKAADSSAAARKMMR